MKHKGNQLYLVPVGELSPEEADGLARDIESTAQEFVGDKFAFSISRVSYIRHAHEIRRQLTDSCSGGASAQWGKLKESEAMYNNALRGENFSRNGYAGTMGQISKAQCLLSSIK